MASSESIGRFMHKVYAWMFAGLAVTAATSYYMFAHPAVLIYLLSSPVVFYALMALQIGLVVYMSSRITSMSYQAAVLSFLAYSSLMGVSLSPIFLVYTMSSICMTFVSAACMFGGMAIYGYYTESDLSRFSSILIMGLWGLIIASFANWFFASSGLDYILSWVGVLLFTALTAYDVQKIKLLAYSMEEDNAAGTMGSKIALLGALQLYLDFINLFLYMLKIMGRKQK
jgi:hypothetical protein